MPPRGQIEEVLAEIREGKIKPCYLLWGEEDYLVEDALQKLLGTLLPAGQRDLNCLVMEGESLDIQRLYEALFTFPILPGPKAVVVKEVKFLQSSRIDRDERIDRIRETARTNVLKAAKEFARFLARRGWRVSDFIESRIWEKSDDEWSVLGEDRSWIKPLLELCLAHGIESAELKGAEDVIYELLAKGIPEGHTLILTARLVDVRLKLYRLIASQGKVLHFAALTGEREKEAQVRAHAEALLSSLGKQLTQDAWDLLGIKTGYDLRETMSQIEKLIIFSGNRKLITEEDVAAVVEKTKEESIFYLTSALARRDEREALKVLNELFERQVPPLSIIALLAREIGLLMRAKIALDEKGILMEKMEMGEFQRRVFSTLKEDAPEIASLHPYVVYHLMKNADHFERSELKEAMVKLSEIDRLMKTTASDPRLLIERFLMSFHL